MAAAGLPAAAICVGAFWCALVRATKGEHDERHPVRGGTEAGRFDVVAAPFSIRLSDQLELQPDVLVGRIEDFTEDDLPAPPVLAVEVLSPSTAIHDLNTKKAVYERLGTASYWVIDPEEPALTVFELDEDGHYQQVAKAAGDEIFEAERPFPIRIVPKELLGRLG
ncbi:Uma2 family endonuclease [Amycolatopsis sp. RTGN1]|uniref:Uma2 family endonuclease n=1 Tax=Amycolatopsis ponsaeliensis TaxID=2992142 RepID=UPI00254A2E75|nr:Uma2 family endonuclease [Amycolatopsis sp. RTGN1]